MTEIPPDHPAVEAACKAWENGKTPLSENMATALTAAWPLMPPHPRLVAALNDQYVERCDRAIEALREIVAVTGVLSDITAHKTYRIATAALRDLGAEDE